MDVCSLRMKISDREVGWYVAGLAESSMRLLVSEFPMASGGRESPDCCGTASQIRGLTSPARQSHSSRSTEFLKNCAGAALRFIQPTMCHRGILIDEALLYHGECI